MAKAFNTESPLVWMEAEDDRPFVVLESAKQKRVIYDVKTIRVQASRATKGVQVMKVKEDDSVKYFNYGNFSAEMLDKYLIGSAGAGKKI